MWDSNPHCRWFKHHFSAHWNNGPHKRVVTHMRKYMNYSGISPDHQLCNANKQTQAVILMFIFRITESNSHAVTNTLRYYESMIYVLI